jgi:L-fuconolactonase
MTRLLDSHIHFWDPAARHHDWLTSEPVLERRFGPADLETGRHDVVGMIFVQADCHDDEALDEVHWVGELARSDRRIRGIVAHAGVHLGAACRGELRDLAAEALVVGVRRLLQGLPATSVVDPELVAGVRQLAEWGLTFDVCVTHDQLPAVASLVAACPETSFVIDHLGKPDVACGQLDPWRDDLSRLAEHRNVVCKLSGLTTETAPGWLAADLRPFLDHALAAFGPERCMFGSDWPVATLQTSFERWVDVVCDAIAGLPRADQAAVLAGTALATYDIAPLYYDRDGSDDGRRTLRR